MFDTTQDLAADILRHTADLQRQLEKLDGYAVALAAVTPEGEQHAAALYAPDRIGDMMATLGRTTASATGNLMRAASRTALAAAKRDPR